MYRDPPLLSRNRVPPEPGSAGELRLRIANSRQPKKSHHAPREGHYSPVDTESEKGRQAGRWAEGKKVHLCKSELFRRPECPLRGVMCPATTQLSRKAHRTTAMRYAQHSRRIPQRGPPTPISSPLLAAARHGPGGARRPFLFGTRAVAEQRLATLAGAHLVSPCRSLRVWNRLSKKAPEKFRSSLNTEGQRSSTSRCCFRRT